MARAAIVAAVVALALFLILSANITVGQESLGVGQVAERDVSAPRDITFVSETQTETARDAAEAAVAPIYEQIVPPADNQADQLRAFDLMARRVTGILEDRDADGLSEAEVIARLGTNVSQLGASSRQLVAGMSVVRWGLVAEAARAALETTLATAIREGEVAQVRRDVRDLVTGDLPESERAMAGELAASFVTANEVISVELTDQARAAARASVADVEVRVQADETIIRAGELITAEDLEKLEELGLTAPRGEAGTVVGNAIVAILLASLIVAFLWRFQPEIWHRNRSVLLFFLVLLVTAVAVRVAADRALWAYVVPTSAAVLLVAILLDAPAGAAMAAALAAIAGVVNSSALSLGMYVLAGGFVSLVAIVSAERLSGFLRAGLLLAVTNLGVVTAFRLLDGSDLAAILQLSVAGVVNAGLAVLLAVGSFAMLGNLFGIMTVFQLLELANPSSRLLRRLLLETPGTYHHSVMVGNLAERAAETIGADPLLARVAAYYHDIGKMKNPLAFIENQAGAHNIHDDLSPETSARIIAGHIRDGIDLAYEHDLPVQIIGYIPQHHGTSVMSYFHGKALGEVGGNEQLVPKDAYRYPGPKPQSREAAILMLADGVEASVRSLDEKDERSIRAMVESIVESRLEDGQLDDAELTLKDIGQIKEAFVQQLLGMYHTRIKYPDNVVPLEQRREA
jgi:cyclic-di-AMP phosphodiesterase PgpH